MPAECHETDDDDDDDGVEMVRERGWRSGRGRRPTFGPSSPGQATDSSRRSPAFRRRSRPFLKRKFLKRKNQGLWAVA